MKQKTFATLVAMPLVGMVASWGPVRIAKADDPISVVASPTNGFEVDIGLSNATDRTLEIRRAQLRFEVREGRNFRACDGNVVASFDNATTTLSIAPSESVSTHTNLRELCWGNRLNAAMLGAEIRLRAQVQGRSSYSNVFQLQGIEVASSTAEAPVEVRAHHVRTSRSSVVPVRVDLIGRGRARGYAEPASFEFELRRDGETIRCALPSDELGNPSSDLFRNLRRPQSLQLDLAQYCNDLKPGFYEAKVFGRVFVQEGNAEPRLQSNLVSPIFFVRIGRSR